MKKLQNFFSYVASATFLLFTLLFANPIHAIGMETNEESISCPSYAAGAADGICMVLGCTQFEWTNYYNIALVDCVNEQ